MAAPSLNQLFMSKLNLLLFIYVGFLFRAHENVEQFACILALVCASMNSNGPAISECEGEN